MSVILVIPPLNGVVSKERQSADTSQASLTSKGMVLGESQRRERHRGHWLRTSGADDVVWKQNASSVVSPLKSVRL